MAVTWNTQVATVTWTAVDDPSVTWVVQVDATVTGGGGVELGETSTTAYRGDRGKTAYDHSQVTTGNPHGTTAADVGADPAGTAAGLVDDLSGVSNQATARTNLGLGTAATAATGDFAAASHTHTGTQVTVDASGFNGNLTTSDDTVQEVAQKLDDLSIPAAGIPASTIDGKGELLVGSANDAVDNLAIGTDGHVLTLDSAQTLGVKWAAASGGIADPGGANDDFLQRKSGAWTNRTVEQVKTDLGVTSLYQNSQSNKYYLPGQIVTSQGNSAITANFIYLNPMVVTNSLTVASVALYLVTGVASSKVRFAIYNASSAWVPTTVVAQTGEIDTSGSAGIKSGALAGGNVTLTPGRYLLAQVSGHNPTMSFLRHGTTSGAGVHGSWIAADGFTVFGTTAMAFTYGAMTDNPGTPTLGGTPIGFGGWLVLA